MRNLTEEAMKMAERDLVRQNPQLRDKFYRETLPQQVKQEVVNLLIFQATMYEQRLIAQFQ